VFSLRNFFFFLCLFFVSKRVVSTEVGAISRFMSVCVLPRSVDRRCRTRRAAAGAHVRTAVKRVV